MTFNGQNFNETILETVFLTSCIKDRCWHLLHLLAKIFDCTTASTPCVAKCSITFLTLHSRLFFINNFYLLRMRLRYCFRSVCVCVCVCVCLGYNFWTSWHRLHFCCGTSWQYLGQIWVSRSLVIPWKMLIWLPGHQFNLVWLIWGEGHKLGQGHTKVIWSRSRSSHGKC